MKIPIDIPTRQLDELEKIGRTMGKSRDEVIKIALAAYQAQAWQELRDEGAKAPGTWNDTFETLDKAGVPDDFLPPEDRNQATVSRSWPPKASRVCRESHRDG